MNSGSDFQAQEADFSYQTECRSLYPTISPILVLVFSQLIIEEFQGHDLICRGLYCAYLTKCEKIPQNG